MATSTTLEKEIAAFEKRFGAAEPQVQEALFSAIKTFIVLLGPSGGVPGDLVGDMVALLQTVGGKLTQGLISEAQFLNTFETNAPILSKRVLAEITG